MAESFFLQVLEEDIRHFSGEAVYCSAVTGNGSIGFKALHEAFAGTLVPGSAFFFKDTEGREREITVRWGVLLFKENRCIVTLAG